MSERKFTDDEIIKAYELCFTPKGTRYTCAKCPFHKFGALCKVERDRAALDLMKRQKAILERLEKGKKNIKFETGDYAKIANNKSGHEFEIGTIVKLEKHDEDYIAFANGDYWWVTDNDLVEIDNDTLVKEMTEESKR